MHTSKAAVAAFCGMHPQAQPVDQAAMRGFRLADQVIEEAALRCSGRRRIPTPIESCFCHRNGLFATAYTRITAEIIAAIEEGAGDWGASWFQNGNQRRRPDQRRIRQALPRHQHRGAAGRSHRQRLQRWPVDTYRQWQDAGAQVSVPACEDRRRPCLGEITGAHGTAQSGFRAGRRDADDKEGDAPASGRILGWRAPVTASKIEVPPRAHSLCRDSHAPTRNGYRAAPLWGRR